MCNIGDLLGEASHEAGRQNSKYIRDNYVNNNSDAITVEFLTYQHASMLHVEEAEEYRRFLLGYRIWDKLDYIDKKEKAWSLWESFKAEIAAL